MISWTLEYARLIKLGLWFCYIIKQELKKIPAPAISMTSAEVALRYFSWIIICDLGQSILSLFPYLWKRIDIQFSGFYEVLCTICEILILYRHTSFYCSLQIVLFFPQIEVLWQPLCLASLSASLFQQYLLTSCLCVILVILAVVQTFLLLLYFAVVFGKHWF